MSLVFRHGIRHSLIQGGEGSNPLQYVRCRTTSDCESMTIEPHQAFAIWRLLPEPEKLLLLVTPANEASNGSLEDTSAFYASSL